MPAKAGIQKYLKTLDTPSTLLRVVSLSNHRHRGYEVKTRSKTIYGTTNFTKKRCVQEGIAIN